MKVVLDACVLYPTVMREIVVGVGAQGLFTPIWSSRLLEEWARAAIKLGPEGEAQARAEVALLRARIPEAELSIRDGIEARLWLPDPNDIHVLGLAVSTSSDAIMTLNKKDFPRSVLAEEGVGRIEPDGYVFTLWQAHPQKVEQVAIDVLNTAKNLSGRDWDMRGLLKKARLPRLAKALSGLG